MSKPYGPPTKKDFDNRQKALAERSRRELRYQYMRERLSDHDLFMNYQSRDFERIISLLGSLKVAKTPPSSPQNTIHAKAHYRELRPLPKDPTRETFGEYVAYLCRGRFYFRKSSQLNVGIVPRLILHLHSLENEEMKHCRSVDSFNNAMYYFAVRKGQLNVAKRLLLSMNIDGCVPNTASFNIVLQAISKYGARTHSQNPLKLAVGILETMRYMNVSADSETWRFVYDTMDNLMARQSVLRLVVDHNVPISRGLCRSVMADIVAARISPKLKATGTDLVAELADLVDTEIVHYDAAMVELVIQVALREGRYLQAYAVYEKYLTYNPRSPVRVRVTTMNVFLEQFAACGRIDLCWAIMNTIRYKSAHLVKPSPETYKHMLQGLYNAGITENWRANVHIILHTMRRKFGTVYLDRSISTLLVKFQVRDKFEDANEQGTLVVDGSRFSKEESRLYKRINLVLHWDRREFDTDVARMPPLSQFREVAHAVGYREVRPRVSVTDVTREEFRSLDHELQLVLREMWAEIEQFHKSTRKQAIQGAHRKKMRVLSGGVGPSLVRELRQRRIV
ncbi:hypothetical protein BABINDRAFT_8559 [Babjeviella inositovora NRRL Y-12698]|uniref:Uncharacterized protein n=1 Tax=Babjeviella inositovora NRRL Y-12698 TaxID=984486 RepID=A0A1E3QPT1_9ASCO|nr:uncharacterized protein BABINDRAFT_8559 [Babjeviella inositovora NRRL Y-12698]ODQ79660.1 hypothetical protein BABINDRAFT_8559 [Babjeviella inositovora NRRL Y-12698]